MLSFWEKQSFLHYDLLVIGGGIVGLSTACSWKEKFPNRSVLVLERGIFPSGASTKNAGFACYGSAAEILHDIAQLGENRAMEVVALRVEGLRKLRNRLGDAAMAYEENGGGEIFLQGETFDLDHLPSLNQMLRSFFEKDVFVPDAKAPELFGFQETLIHQFVRNTVEGQIDTGRMMKSLMAYAGQLGVEIRTGCDCLKPELHNGFWRTTLKNSVIEFSSAQVAICTNAFTDAFFPELDIYPGRGQVLITKPIENLLFKGIFHFDEGYYYFRNVGQRVLFGGGRNLDFEAETTHENALNPQIQDKLEYYLRTLILPLGTKFDIEDRWSGIMAFGAEKTPIIRNLENGLVLGVRMNGMGVAMGTEVGHRLVQMLD